jgi:hypothetical protein
MKWIYPKYEVCQIQTIMLGLPREQTQLVFS